MEKGCGLGPVSIAADGGGSIRIPAAFCGQVGIKPTCGLVPLTVAIPLMLEFAFYSFFIKRETLLALGALWMWLVL